MLAKRPAKLLAGLVFAAIVGILIAVFAAGSTPTTNTTTKPPSWSESAQTGGGFENQVSVDPMDGSHVLLANDVGGIQYSSNGGQSWQPRNAYALGIIIDRTAAIVWDPALAGVVYALAGDGRTGGLLKSSDYGWTWSVQSKSLIGVGNGVDPTLGAATGLPVGHPRPVGSLISFDASNVFVGTFSSGLMRAQKTQTANASAWTPVALAPGYLGISHYYIRSVVSDDTSPEILYVSTHTANNAASGRVWRIAAANTASPVLTELTGSPMNVQSLFQIGGNLYGVTNSGPSGPGLYRLGAAASSSPSNQWRRVSGLNYSNSATIWYSVTGYQSGGATTLFVSDANPPTLNGLAEPVFEGTSNDGFTTDGTWQPIPSTTSVIHSIPALTLAQWWIFKDPGTIRWGILGSPVMSVASVSFSPDHTTILLAGESGVWVTNDNGANWTPAVVGLGAAVNFAVATDPYRPGVAYIANRDYQFFTTADHAQSVARDRPTNTAANNMGHAVFADATQASSTVYLSIGSPDCLSAGQIWTKIEFGTGAGGWTNLTPVNGFPGAHCATSVAVIHPAGATVLLAAVKGDGVWRRTLAPTLGAWQAPASTTPGSGDSEFSVASAGNQALLFDESSGLWASTDGGGHWQLRFPYVATAEGDGNLAASRSLGDVFVSIRTGIYRMTGLFGTGPLSQTTVRSVPNESYGPIAVGNARLVAAIQPNVTAGLHQSIIEYPLSNLASPVNLTDDLYLNGATKVLGLGVAPDGTIYAALAGDGLLVWR